MGEVPLLKELDQKYHQRGFALIGVSIDEDVKAAQATIANKALTWPHVHDGKNGQIAKLFNAKGTPTYYVLDRDGKIAAKNVPGDKLSKIIADLLAK